MLATTKNSAISAMPAASSAVDGAASKRYHQNAAANVSAPAAANEIASSARGVSTASCGRDLNSSATPTSDANATTSHAAPYINVMRNVSETESG